MLKIKRENQKNSKVTNKCNKEPNEEIVFMKLYRRIGGKST